MVTGVVQQFDQTELESALGEKLKDAEGRDVRSLTEEKAIADYLDELVLKYLTGQATEHSYRPALQALFQSIDPALTVINEPKKSEAGMPDFLFQRGVIPFGWAEAKDIDKDVIKLKGYSVEQRKRYEKAYPNLIYTNGVDFEFIREGESVHFVSIADFMGQLGGLQALPDKFDSGPPKMSR